MEARPLSSALQDKAVIEDTRLAGMRSVIDGHPCRAYACCPSSANESTSSSAMTDLRKSPNDVAGVSIPQAPAHDAHTALALSVATLSGDEILFHMASSSTASDVYAKVQKLFTSAWARESPMAILHNGNILPKGPVDLRAFGVRSGDRLSAVLICHREVKVHVYQSNRKLPNTGMVILDPLRPLGIQFEHVSKTARRLMESTRKVLWSAKVHACASGEALPEYWQESVGRHLDMQVALNAALSEEEDIVVCV